MRRMASTGARWIKRGCRWCLRPLARRILAALDRRQAARMHNMTMGMLDFQARLTQRVADEIAALSRDVESRSSRAA